MPGGDGTGPRGFGPLTGRGLGFCAGYNTPGYIQPGPGFGGRFWGRGGGFGRGFGGGFGRGYGRGFGRGYGGYWGVPLAPPAGYPAAGVPVTPAQEVEMLRAQKQYLEQEQAGVKEDLDALEKRIQELEKRKE
ncbi:MAG: DUF5320 domain-containing protein [Candidatus Lokiarchaeota archaeon]|nr:DUF5320 domain-containing protein [Candidatus Lokiarchaeota archaeon]